MNINFIAMGKLKESWYREACAEYLKRLGAYVTPRVSEPAPVDLPQKPSPAQIEAALRQEAVKIREQIKPGELELRLNDETLATVKLITESDIQIDANEFYMEKIKQIISNPMFKAIVGLCVVELILAIVTHQLKLNYRRKVAEMNRRRRINPTPAKKKGKW